MNFVFFFIDSIEFNHQIKDPPWRTQLLDIPSKAALIEVGVAEFCAMMMVAR